MAKNGCFAADFIGSGIELRRSNCGFPGSRWSFGMTVVVVVRLVVSGWVACTGELLKGNCGRNLRVHEVGDSDDQESGKKDRDDQQYCDKAHEV